MLKQYNQLKLINFFSILSLILIIGHIISVFTKLYIQNNASNFGFDSNFKGNYFNDNSYSFLDLILRVIIGVLIAPVFEEVIFRIWLNKKILLKLKNMYIYLVFIVLAILSIFKYIYPLIYNRIFLSIVNQFNFGYIRINNYVEFVYYILPIIVSLILYLIIIVILKNNFVKELMIKLIYNNYIFLYLFSTIIFSLNHLNINVFVDKKFNLQSLIQFVNSFVFSILMIKISNVISFKFSVLFHSLNNLIVAIGYSFFSNKLTSNSFNYILIPILIIIVYLMYSEYHNAKIQNKS